MKHKALWIVIPILLELVLLASFFYTPGKDGSSEPSSVSASSEPESGDTKPADEQKAEDKTGTPGKDGASEPADSQKTGYQEAADQNEQDAVDSQKTGSQTGKS